MELFSEKGISVQNFEGFLKLSMDPNCVAIALCSVINRSGHFATIKLKHFLLISQLNSTHRHLPVQVTD